MTKSRLLLAGLALILALSLINLSSAYTNYYPIMGNTYGYSPDSDYNWNSRSNSQSLNIGPSYSTLDRLSKNYMSYNLDSGSSYSSSTGPYLKMKVKYDEILRYDDGDWVKKISYSDNSFVIGGSQVQASGYQNNEYTGWTVDQESQKVYQGAFSWSKTDSYDSSDYDSGNWNNYYYSPVYSNGFYNWRY